MAESKFTQESTNERVIEVRITPTIERDYKRREVFSTLRIEHAEHVLNGATGVYRLTAAFAEEVLADALALYSGREAVRGLKVAYGSLHDKLEAAVRAEKRRGVWDDPGKDEAMRRMAQSSARFEVGDKVLYFVGGDYDYEGYEANIVESYKMYTVTEPDGAYIDSNGARFDYKFGYVIKTNDPAHRFWVPPYTLTRDDDGKPSYLRLVETRPPARASA